MFAVCVLRRACGRGGLPLWLLVSLLLHWSVIALSYPGRAANDGRPPLLRASWHRGVDDAPPAHLTPAPLPAPPASEHVAAPALEQRVSGVSANEAPDLAPAGDLPPAAGYYAAQSLTIRPLALSEPLLDDGELFGAIVLALWIDSRGAVAEVSIERSDLPVDRQAAVADAFRLVRFSPGELNGQKVGSVMRIEVSYDDERLPIEP